MRIGVILDMRNPHGEPWARRYAAALEYAEEADRLGLDAIAVAEHHGWDDGFIPRPLMLLAAIAGRTARARLATVILLAPFYDTVALAEEAALVDCMSGGRLDLGLGAAYQVPEFELFGLDKHDRYRIYEERVVGIRRLWNSGAVQPQPVQDPLPLWAGLRGPRSAHLAGRLGMGMLFMQDDHWTTYLAGLREGGHGESAARLGGPILAMLSEDPERDFASLAPRVVDHWAAYEHYSTAGTGRTAPPPLSAEEYRRIGAISSAELGKQRNAGVGGSPRAYGFSLWTPDEAAAQLRAVANDRAVDCVYLYASLGGDIDEHAYRSLELIVKRLKPLLAEEEARLPRPVGSAGDMTARAR